MSELSPDMLAMQKAMMECVLHEAQLKMRAAHEMWQEAAAKRKEAEESLEQCRYNRKFDKNNRRPSREFWVDLHFDTDKNQWAAEARGVTAYGDTPEMACDNFDHLWMFGDNNGR